MLATFTFIPLQMNQIEFEVQVVWHTQMISTLLQFIAVHATDISHNEKINDNNKIAARDICTNSQTPI